MITGGEVISMFTFAGNVAALAESENGLQDNLLNMKRRLHDFDMKVKRRRQEWLAI